jgi:hypothetical protein
MKRTRLASLSLALIIPTACGDHEPTGIRAPAAPLYEVSTPAAPAGAPGGDTSPGDAGIVVERGPNTMGSGG